jgi:hypothetical protein
MLKKICTLVFLIFAIPGPMLADDITIIELQNRPASEIIPIIKPMLDESGSLTGTDFQLFVQTSPGNLEQVQMMVRKLDIAALQLVISVFQGNDRDLRALSMTGGLNYENDNLNAGIGNRNAPDRERGSSIGYSTRSLSASGSSISTRGRLSDNPIQQLLISDGTEGYIETGQSIPYFSGDIWLGARGRGVVSPGMDYREVPTGFYVLPRVHGNQVTLDVSPYKQSVSKTNSGTVNTQRASTQITGKLGQWLQIGGTRESIQGSSMSTGSRMSTQSRDNSSIWIKVEPQP